MALELVCLVQFTVVLDVVIVTLALPSIKNALGFSNEALQWVLSAYTLAFGGLLLLREGCCCSASAPESCSGDGWPTR